MTTHKLLLPSRIGLLILLIMTAFTSTSWAATYYVATSGNDGSAGAINTPLRTIQYAVNLLQPGDTCLIRSGTYNEAIILKQSGTSTAPITLKSYPGETVTINSGNSKAITVSKKLHYYTIDGLRIVSNHVSYTTGRDWSLDFQGPVWDGNNAPTGGNNGFIIQNCYIEGAVLFYGHNNTVQNCELNGKNLWKDGIWDFYASSHHNIYRNNKIHDYTERGVWTMQYTDSILIEGNTIYNIGNCGIDCDGAGHPVYNSIVRGNTIYNAAGRGIEMENGFGGIVEKNVIYNCGLGIHWINYGFSPDFNADAEYRNLPTNGITRYNLVYNSTTGSIVLRAAQNVKVYNNTIHSNNASSYYAGIALIKYGGFFPSNADIRNNIVSQSNPYAVWIDNTPAGIAGIVTMNNNNYSHDTKSNIFWFSGSSQAMTLSSYSAATGQDKNSSFTSPQFVSTTAPDFSLKITSPCRNAGINLGLVSDIKGDSVSSTPTIGAYESVLTLTPPANLLIK